MTFNVLIACSHQFQCTEGKHSKNETFGKRYRYHNHVIPLHEFSRETTNLNQCPVIVTFLNYPGARWKGTERTILRPGDETPVQF